MLIDWLSISVPFSALTPEQIQHVEGMADKIRRYCPRTGEVVWETTAWESVRSDSHQVAVKAGADCLYVQGSPARCMGDGDTVFGSDHAMDIKACAKAMLDFAWMVSGLGVVGFQLSAIKVTRIDVTGNLVLDSLAHVRQALGYLRGVEGGRYRVSQTSGDTVYWSHRSKLSSGKAYAKGPHLRYLGKRGSYTGISYGEAYVLAAERLLRLELSLKSQFMRERASVAWYDMDERYLTDQWIKYFGRMVGDVSIEDETMVQVAIMAAARDLAVASARSKGKEITDSTGVGAGKAAFSAWCMIKSQGWQWTRDNTAKSTWYRHMKIFRAAGLGDMDVSHGSVVGIRRQTLVLRPVTSWMDLLAA